MSVALLKLVLKVRAALRTSKLHLTTTTVGFVLALDLSSSGQLAIDAPVLIAGLERS